MLDQHNDDMEQFFGFVLTNEDGRGMLTILRNVRSYAILENDCDCDDEDCECQSVDVRLQVHDGTWAIHAGDASYDQDHRGFWGASSVSANTDGDDLTSILEDLVDQALEHASQCV
jgi:hypothetical protein